MKIRSLARKFVLNRIPWQTPEWISRGYTLFFILSLVIVFGGVALIPSVTSAIQEEKWISLSALFGIYAIILILMFRKNLSYYIRGYVLCFSLAVVGYVSLSSIGLISSARLWFLCSAVLACLLIGGKSAFIIFAISFLVFVGFGFKTDFAIKLPSEPDHIVWVITLTTFVLVNILVVGATYLIVSGLKKAEASLRESEERFRLFAELAPVGIILSDKQGNTLYASPKFTELFGYTMSDIPSVIQWWALAYPDEELRTRIRSEWETAIDEASKTHREIKPLEFPVTCKDGTVRQIEFRIRAADDLDVIVFSDITERKQAENELNMAHVRILTILDSIDSTVYVADMNTCEILFMNKRMITDFGGDKTGDVCYRAFRKKSKPCEGCTNDKLVDKHGNPTGVHVWQDKHPVTGRYYINYDRAIEWTDGRMVRMQIATDITDLKKMENQLLQAQKMESVGRLAGGVAHDFNNLLQAMSGNTELLLQGKSEDHPDAMRLQILARNMNRAAKLVQQLLLFSRKAASRKMLVDLNVEVEDVIQMLERTIPKMIVQELHLDPKSWTVHADPVQIQQVLLNLANNAVDAMPDGGKLVIETSNIVLDEDFINFHPGSTAGPHVLLSVTDTGCGMDNETLRHIFDPFFTTKELGRGTGLGLASIYGIVKAHGGYIQCYSEQGLGTTFRIYLPAVEQGEATQVERIPEPSPRGGDETILVVDDESEIRAVARESLETFGYVLKEAATGEEALDMYKEEGGSIDLVLLDLNMPGMGGYKCLKEFLRIDPKVKVLIASGYTANSRGEDVFSAGAKGFLGKPYQLADLLSKIRETLDAD